jgi:hypothetical protein
LEILPEINDEIADSFEPENQILNLKDLFDLEKSKNVEYVTVKDSDGNTQTIKKEILMLQISTQESLKLLTRRGNSPLKSPKKYSISFEK